MWGDAISSRRHGNFITNTLEECPRTGTMIVHWVRKVCSRELTLFLVFMMFCSNFYILVCVKACSFHSSVVIGSMSLVIADLGVWKDILLCDKGMALHCLIIDLLLSCCSWPFGVNILYEMLHRVVEGVHQSWSSSWEHFKEICAIWCNPNQL